MGDTEPTRTEWTRGVRDRWPTTQIADAAFAALVECYRATPLVRGRGKVVLVRREGDDALLDFDWETDARIYTIRVGLPVDDDQPVDNGRVLESNIFSYENDGRSLGPLEWVLGVADFIDEALMTGATNGPFRSREPTFELDLAGRY